MAVFPTDTIAAIATAPGEAGVGVVRVSGPAAVAVAGRLARGRPRLEDMDSHTVRHAWIHDAEGHALDEALVTVLRAPRTFTGEDVVEIGVHGGTVPARRVLRALLAAGARLAERGEFTKRAFLHGRLDLSQAEAVADLVSARTERGADAALAALGGRLGRRTRDVEERLLDLLAGLEAGLDFAEDVGERDPGEVRAALGECATALDELWRRVPWGRRLRDGATVVIAGRPNVGKSSLFNALLEDDRALVSPDPGTTRDWIEAWVDIGGVPVRLVDTAGVRATGELVEAEGVRRARSLGESADLLLVVLDGSEPPTAEDMEVLTRTEGRARLVLSNKADRAGAGGGAFPSAPDERISAVTGEGVATLRERITARLLEGVGREPDDGVVPGERHEDSLRRAREALGHAIATTSAGGSDELVAGDVRDAASALGEITGRTVVPEVLDRIFSRFCLGK